uniref:Putative secreted protein n=1 Tax=Anopheles marajoara TaxID=58244 RepID=A0A2M4C5N2_9DIPT
MLVTHRPVHLVLLFALFLLHRDTTAVMPFEGGSFCSTTHLDHTWWQRAAAVSVASGGGHASTAQYSRLIPVAGEPVALVTIDVPWQLGSVRSPVLRVGPRIALLLTAQHELTAQHLLRLLVLLQLLQVLLKLLALLVAQALELLQRMVFRGIVSISWLQYLFPGDRSVAIDCLAAAAAVITAKGHDRVVVAYDPLIHMPMTMLTVGVARCCSSFTTAHW